MKTGGQIVKSIDLIGFIGVGIRDKQYQAEPGLIKVGHVGICFENEDRILGFHPTPEAIDAIGGAREAMNWLRNRKDGNRLDGSLQDDTAIFERAYQLSLQGARCTVWQQTISVDEDTFKSIRTQANQWYEEQTLFPYAFPLSIDDIEWDNCATFPRRLGLTLPETTGQLQRYIPQLQANGKAWRPKGAEE